MDIKPGQYRVAIQFIEDDSSLEDSDVEMAVVVGVGFDVKGIKKGDTALVFKEAREHGVKVDGSTFIIHDGAIAGTVAK